MDPLLGSALISGASNILGGLFGQSAADKNRQAQVQQAELNRQTQIDFAKKAIQWKVEDAKSAGIHPLYALGASTQSYSPVSIGSTADNSLGEGLARAGQDISRAVAATADRELRAIQFKSAQLELEKKGLENDVLRTELASKLQRVSQPGTPPAMPNLTDIAGNKQARVALGGSTLTQNPNWSEAQVIQNVYGEPAEWIYFFPKSAADAYHNYRNYLTDWGRNPNNAALVHQKANRYFNYIFK